jgi:hypothetical protein
MGICLVIDLKTGGGHLSPAKAVAEEIIIGTACLRNGPGRFIIKF